MLSIDDAIKMQGTDFIYTFKSGDTMLAYIKKFDPKVGLSCWSYSLTTDKGLVFDPLNKDEESEGACCVIIYNFEEEGDTLERAMAVLDEITLTGSYTEHNIGDGTFSGCTL